MIAVKNWFLEKNNMTYLRGMELVQEKETAKAILVSFETKRFKTETVWIPKSVIIDEWEKDTSNFGYHDYLVNVYHKAYEEGKFENFTIKSGRNEYRGDNFVHQWTTKKLIEKLEENKIDFMRRKEWNER